MDYNSFLTRDYKSMAAPISRSRKTWTHLHTIVVLASIMAISTILVLMSQNADAMRSNDVATTPPVTRQINENSRNSQITMPLAIPQEVETPTAIVTPNPASNNTLSSWKSFKVKTGDSLALLFQRNNLDSSELHRIMSLGKETRQLRYIKPGQQFHVALDESNRINELNFEINKLETLKIQRDGDSFKASTYTRPVETRISQAAGTIDSSLFESGKASGLPDALIMQLVGIFGWDIDFALDIRQGDQFTLLFEEQYLEGQKLRNGAILAAEFINQGRSYRAIRFTDANGKSDYYSPDGHSMRKAFLRTPVDFRRISSRFGKRHHPVLNKLKMHKGVDYAAARGTPIKAAGDGKIVFRGLKGGYGRVVIIQHGGKYSTLYAHMNGFKRGLHSGSRVRQGQVIGYVGSSGRATGPHLHYEFRVNGVHRNPLTIRLPDAAPIAKTYKDDFKTLAQAYIAQLDALKTTRLALQQ